MKEKEKRNTQFDDATDWLGMVNFLLLSLH